MPKCNEDNSHGGDGDDCDCDFENDGNENGDNNDDGYRTMCAVHVRCIMHV